MRPSRSFEFIGAAVLCALVACERKPEIDWAASENIFAVEKQSNAPVGVPPETVADYLRAVIMAHRHFYTIHIANRLRQERIVDVSENWRTTHSLPLPVQLIRETSEIAELTGPNVRYRLISQWPINKDNAPGTEFERRGLKEVQARPNRPYSSSSSTPWFVIVISSTFVQSVVAG